MNGRCEEPMEMRYMETVEHPDAPKCACGKTAIYYLSGQISVLKLCEKCYTKAIEEDKKKSTTPPTRGEAWKETDKP